MLDKAYDPKLVEEKWSRVWLEKRYFQANPHSGKKPYCIVIPPPNVTGVLHMGHALVDTLIDILIRLKRMQGFEALWIPGTDHAGIATQTVVERRLLQLHKKRRTDYTKEAFLKKVWAWKEQSESTILSQIKRLGASCDWSRLRFTMDPGCNRAVRVAFKKLFDKGLIYQGDYLVNWDPVSQTALSDDEVEHEEIDSSMWHIRYPVEGTDASIVVATTRPETMLADTAVAVHPNDERYQALVGKQVRLPLTNRLIPIIADHMVDPAFGTGALKITPAHDFNDFETAKRHDLPLLNLLTPDAKINQLGGVFAGLDVSEARIAVVKALKEQGYLVQIVPHKLRIGVGYRSKAVVQPYLSKQWFVKMSAFKERLIAIVQNKEVKLIPAHWEETYYHWINNLRDWCISRQIWWGHPIPVWHSLDHPGTVICSDSEAAPPEVKAHPDRWKADPDVLDTWFSSALWPLSTLGWPDTTPDFEMFYPTATLITGHDILFFWVARMMLMGEVLVQEKPFYETFLHGLIYGKSYWRKGPQGEHIYVSADERRSFDLGKELPLDVGSKWEKMSKTKGNVIDPLEIIDTYGADAMRIALTSSVTHARQIDLDLRKFEEFKNFANKLWNGARFVFMNIEDMTGALFSEGIDPALLELEDRWILSIYHRTVRDVSRMLEEYTFDKAAIRAYAFFWDDFCAQYVELTKPVLFGKRGDTALKANKQRLLIVLLAGALRLLHPIVPFITEELFAALQGKLQEGLSVETAEPHTKETALALSSPACAVAPYPIAEASMMAPDAEETMATLFEVVRSIRSIRTDMKLPPSEKAELYCTGKCSVLQRYVHIIYALTPTSMVHFQAAASDQFGSTATVENMNLFVPVPRAMRAQEQERLLKEKAKLQAQIEGTRAKLSQSEFIQKAPADIVAKLQANLQQWTNELGEMERRLKSLN
ncbi:MAG: valyl-tRNA synthetase [Chlamydiota bacterium]|jgi:valyl-tRNA synthetase